MASSTEDARFIHLGKLQGEYQENHPLYVELCRALSQELEALFQDAEITLASPIESRVKEWNSIEEKFIRTQSMPVSVR